MNANLSKIEISHAETKDIRFEGVFGGSLTAERASAAADARQPFVAIFSTDADTRNLYRALLTTWNYETAEIQGIEELFRLAKIKSPDLILVDLTLPFGSGLAAMSEMRKSDALKAVPFVSVSGFDQLSFREAAAAKGASEFLVKPVDFETLKVSLNKLICRETDERHSEGISQSTLRP